MLLQCLSSLIALFLALSPANAQQEIMQQFNRSAGNWPQIYRATCVSDTSNATTYNSASFQAITIPGVHASDQVVVYVGVFGEDSATTWSINSMTVDGAGATEINDEDGSGLTNTGFYRIGPVFNADVVNVSVTMSEAVTSAGVCVWAVRWPNAAAPVANVVDDDASNGALVLTTGAAGPGGYVMCVSTTDATGESVTWAVATEQEDTCHGEACYSTAQAVTTGGSMSITSDSGASGTSDASGSCIAVR